MSDLLAWADWALSMGWWVAPLSGTDKTSYNWHKLASNDREQVRDWFSPGLISEQTTGYVVCLKRSGVYVCDVDRPDVSLPGYMPPTLTVQSSTHKESSLPKLHYYYSDAEEISSTLPGELPSGAGQFKGRGSSANSHGGYVVGPGSLHFPKNGAVLSEPDGTYSLYGEVLTVSTVSPDWVEALSSERRKKKEAFQKVFGDQAALGPGEDFKLPMGLEEVDLNRWALEEYRFELSNLSSIGLGYRNSALPILGSIVRIAKDPHNSLTLDQAWKHVLAVTLPSNRRNDVNHWHLQSLQSRWRYVIRTYDDFKGA